MTRVVWHTPEGGEKVEVGKVAILAKLLFINGEKRRKVADLQCPPERDDRGQVVLRFGPQDWCAVSFPSCKQSDEFAQAAFTATLRKHANTSGSNADASKHKSEAMRAALLAAARQNTTELNDADVAVGTATKPKVPGAMARAAVQQAAEPERKDTCCQNEEGPQQIASTSSASKRAITPQCSSTAAAVTAAASSAAAVAPETAGTLPPAAVAGVAAPATVVRESATGADEPVKPATESCTVAESHRAQIADAWQHTEEAVRAAVARAAHPASGSCSEQFIDPLPEQQPAPWPETHHGVACQEAQIWRLVKDLCAAWQVADAKRCEQHKKSCEWLRGQLDECSRARQQAEREARNVDGQLRKAEANMVALEKTKKFQEEEIAAFKKLLQENKRADPSRLRFLEQEVAALREQLRETWESPPKRAKRSNPKSPPYTAQHPTPVGKDACWSGNGMAVGIAQFEAAPLLQCPPQDRHLLRKRLLMKWHPDKQPSAEHALLAKRVMQEMQNLAEWIA